MELKKNNSTKITLGVVGLIIGLILKFPLVQESFPPQYRILGLTFSESQYSLINLISILIILMSGVYMVILLIDLFKKRSKH